MDKVERMIRLKRAKECQREIEAEAAVLAAEEYNRARAKATERDNAIADALAKKKQQKLAEEKEIQKVFEESPELRALVAQLEANKLNKVREQQIREKQDIHSHTKHLDLRAHNEMEAVRQANLQREAEENARRRAELRQQKQVLEHQMKEKDYERVRAFVEYQREKDQIDGIVKKIQDEDMQETLERQEKQRRMQDSFKSYINERETLKLAKRDMEEEDDRRIVEFMKMQSRREADQSAKLKAKQDEQQRILEHQTRAINEERAQNEELERLMMEYHIEVRQEKDAQAEEQRMYRQKQARDDMNNANFTQKRIRAAKEEAERQEELRFQQQMVDRFKEDDRREQEKSVQRQQRKELHKSDVAALSDQKRQMREAERQREIDEQNKEAAREARRKLIADQIAERLRRGESIFPS